MAEETYFQLNSFHNVKDWKLWNINLACKYLQSNAYRMKFISYNRENTSSDNIDILPIELNKTQKGQQTENINETNKFVYKQEVLI